jgi:tetratricopeptide (TPR) repeat protein
VLLRGLSPDPADRFPTMDALLDAIQRTRLRRRRLLGVAGLAVVIAAGVAAVFIGREDRRCTGARARLTGTWDPDRKQRLQLAFQATVSPFAMESWRAMEPILDRYTETWVGSYHEACAATRILRTQSEQVLDLRMECLEMRRKELSALVTVLEHATAAVQENALEAVERLTPLSRCEATAALRSEAEPALTAEQRRRLGEVRTLLARAKAQGDAAQYAEARSIAAKAEETARKAGLRVAHADALLLQGAVELVAGDARAAAHSAEEALLIAERFQMDALAARAWILLGRAVGAAQLRPNAGLRMVRHAQAFAARSGSSPELELEVEQLTGVIYFVAERFDEAVVHYRAALKLAGELYGENQLAAANLRNNLGTCLAVLRRFPEALTEYRAALRIREKLLGPNHPAVAGAINNIGLALSRIGKLDTAREYFRQALAREERALGGAHPQIANALTNLGVVQMFSGRYDEAEKALARGRSMRAQLLGEENAPVSTSLFHLASLMEVRGRLEAAESYARRAVAIREKTLPSEHPAVGRSLNLLGIILSRRGHLDEALVLHRRALALGEARPRRGREIVAGALFGIGRVLFLRGDLAGARGALERARKIPAKEWLPSLLPARIAFALAQVLDATKSEPRRALALAEEARGQLRAYHAQADLSAVERWLAARATGPAR